MAGTKANPETTMSVQMNGDTGSNYSYMQRIMRSDDTQTTNSSTPTSVVTIGLEGNSAEHHAPGWALIPDYLGTAAEFLVACTFGSTELPTSDVDDSDGGSEGN